MPKTSEEYVEESGVNCPGCGSSNIDGGFVETNDGGATQPMMCNECGATWVDTYKLTGYEDLEQ